jgi:hypothetical protein
MAVGAHAKTKADLKDAKESRTFWREKHDREEQCRITMQSLYWENVVDAVSTRAEHAALEDWVVQNYRTFLTKKGLPLRNAICKAATSAGYRANIDRFSDNSASWVIISAGSGDRKLDISFVFTGNTDVLEAVRIWKGPDETAVNIFKQPKAKA